MLVPVLATTSRAYIPFVVVCPHVPTQDLDIVPLKERQSGFRRDDLHLDVLILGMFSSSLCNSETAYLHEFTDDERCLD